MKPSAIDRSTSTQNAPTTLLELLRRQAREIPDSPAYTFRWDDGQVTGLTFAELDIEARKIAAALEGIVAAGERAVLVYPPGLDFLKAFFGCIYAGVLAVPATYPKPRRPAPRLLAIATNCEARVALTTAQVLTTLDLDRAAPEVRAMRWLATDELPGDAADHWVTPAITSNDLAFLQYTSGSTSDPKGVMVSHGNLIHNLEMIRQGFDIERMVAESTSNNGVSWLPAYHDMGLIGGILESMYVGGHSVLMSPASFLQRPIRWLQAISDYGAVVSGAPNFGYELCVRKTTPEERAGLDLSTWRVAFCGAEPVRPETLAEFTETFAPYGFRPDAFYPCFGLAEATLLAAGGHGPSRPTILRVDREALARHHVVVAENADPNQVHELVACGQPLLDQQIVIADPELRIRQASNTVGEIWIKGPNVGRGYWEQDAENEQTFRARLADTDEGPFLRTGDLGFLNEGKLYVTGRVKDVIIIRGRNHYPQDIEHTVENAHPMLQTGAGAAFSIDVEGRERLVVVQEIERQNRNADFPAIIRDIRRAIATEHELDVHAVMLIRQANLPRTTSGKVQRNLCRQRYLADDLKTLAQWVRDGGAVGATEGKEHRHDRHSDKKRAPAATPAKRAMPEFRRPDRPLRPEELDRLTEQIQGEIASWLVDRAAVAKADIDSQKPFAEYGLDSLTAVELSQELEDWLKIELTPVIAWNYPTLATLSRYLAEQVNPSPTGDDDGREPAKIDAEPSVPAAAGPSANDLERMLAEIESLSEGEAEAALNRLSGGERGDVTR